jgi:hypothetical protein
VARAFAATDYADKALTGTVGADGAGLITFGPVDPSHVWRVTRVAVGSIGSLVEGMCFLYVGDVLPQNYRDGTTTPTLDVAEYPAPLVVPATIVLNLQWLSMTPGAKLWAGVQYVDLLEYAVPDNTLPPTVIG